MKSMIALFIGLLCGPVFAGELENVLSAYQKAKAVTMNFEKVSVNEVFGTERSASGKLMLHSGLFRMETEGAEKTLLIMDGKTIWFVQTMEDGGNDLTVVNKSSANTLKKSNSVMALLFDGKKVQKLFKIDDVKSEAGVKRFTLSPKDAKNSEIEKLQISTKKNRIEQVTFWDDRQNKTTYTFTDIDFKAKVSTKDFAYSPPKGAEVVEN